MMIVEEKEDVEEIAPDLDRGHVIEVDVRIHLVVQGQEKEEEDKNCFRSFCNKLFVELRITTMQRVVESVNKPFVELKITRSIAGECNELFLEPDITTVHCVEDTFSFQNN